MVRVEFTLVQVLSLCTGRTAYRASRGIALPFHDHGTRRSEGSASRPGRFLLPTKTRYPFYRRLGGPRGRSGEVRKISPPPGFDPRIVEPVASRYTDWATRPNINEWVFHKFEVFTAVLMKIRSVVVCDTIMNGKWLRGLLLPVYGRKIVLQHMFCSVNIELLFKSLFSTRNGCVCVYVYVCVCMRVCMCMYV